MTQDERRDQRRVNLDPEYTVSFSLGDRSFSLLPTPNLSGGGVCVMVPSDQARLFDRGTVLKDLVLEHPRLPKDPIQAEVAYTLGAGHPGTMPFVGVGVKFVSVPPAAQEALNAFVAGHFVKA
jgi:hypothetical protein